MTPLIGRDRELRSLEARLARVPSRGGSLLLYGDPGIGKSALLNAAAERWIERGWRTLQTDGAPSEMPLPFAALHKLLRPTISEASRLTAVQRDALAGAFGMVESPAPQMFRVALAALDLLAEAAAEQPLLLLVEDTQWLDRSSSEVLAFVARRVVSDPIFLLATSRPFVEDPLVEGIESRLQLVALDDSDAAQLLSQNGQELDARTQRAVLEAAAGNPLALVELPKAFSRVADIDPQAPWLPMTDRLERAFAARISQLGGVTRDLLLLAALMDADDVSVPIRAASVMRDQTVDVDDLAPAAAAGLVELNWRSVRFRHPLVRSAVYQSASPARRQVGNAALAEVLAGDPDRCAWHRAEATLEADESVALDLATAARRAARRGATSEAIALWECSARLSVPSSRRAGRLLRAAELAADLGDTRLNAHLARMLDECNLGHHDRLRLESVREMTQPTMLGRVARIEALLDLADQANADGDLELALRFLWRAALRCWTTGLDEVGYRVLAACDRLGHARGDPSLIVSRAYAAPFEDARAITKILQDPKLLNSVDPSGLYLLGHAAATLGDFQHAEYLLTTATEGLREDGRLAVLARALLLLAFATLRRSRWDAAAAAAEECVRLAEETRQPLVRADSFSVQAMLASLRGRLDDAERLAVQGEELAARWGFAVTLATIQNARAMRAIAAGEPDVAFDELYRVYHRSDPAYHRMQGCWAIGNLVEYALMSDHVEEARTEVAKLEPLAAMTSAPGVHISLRYARALLAPDDQAEDLFAAALDPALGDWPFNKARTCLAYGAWLRRNKRITDSRRPLRGARDIFDRLGAPPWAERARQELRAAGETSRRRQPEAWDQLSPQETQIVQMVTEGLSNKEIGQRLYLSHRTVASHLYRIFPKLGVASRTQLLSALASEPTPQRR